MVLRQAPAFHAQDPLGGPGINLDLAEHQPVAVPGKGDVLVLDQPIEVGAAQVEIAGDIVGAESPVGHTHWGGEVAAGKQA